MAQASKKGFGAHPTGQQGAKGAGKSEVGEQLDEFDFSDEIHGRNSLQGNDQENFRNERQAQAGATGETEGLIESFEKTEERERSARKRDE